LQRNPESHLRILARKQHHEHLLRRARLIAARSAGSRTSMSHIVIGIPPRWPDRLPLGWLAYGIQKGDDIPPWLRQRLVAPKSSQASSRIEGHGAHEAPADHTEPKDR
jgi:hypothetical protein